MAWLWVAAWAGLIQTLGGNGFSQNETSRFLGPLLAWLFPAAGPDLLAHAQFAIRKSAHLFEYAVLGALALRAWRLSASWPFARCAAASLALVLAVAAVDETRQTTTRDREGSPLDVALDTFGGALGLGLAVAVPRWRRR